MKELEKWNKRKRYQRDTDIVDEKRGKKVKRHRSGNIFPVAVDSISDNPVPSCEHGPCLLFERKKESGEVQRFYSCAVYRSRKRCPFYCELRSDGSVDKAKSSKRRHYDNSERAASKMKHKQFHEKFVQLRTAEKGVLYCFDCGLLLALDEGKRLHQEHHLSEELDNRRLNRPSRLLRPLLDKEGESQFWYSEKTLNFLTNLVLTQKFQSVLLVGAPRLFESLREQRVRSMLLDFDKRYEAFWSPKQFARYSMLVNHVFTKLGKKALGRFFQKAEANMLIFCDPPFGALMQPLIASLNRLAEQASVETNIMVSCPYYVESKILECDSRFSLLDYKVAYENHPDLKGNKSTVRLFTTCDPSTMNLPAGEGYRFCQTCRRFVAGENRHCDICQRCTSKDGKPWIHCQKCDKCVKMAYVHCKNCGKCHSSSCQKLN